MGPLSAPEYECCVVVVAQDKGSLRSPWVPSAPRLFQTVFNWSAVEQWVLPLGSIEAGLSAIRE